MIVVDGVVISGRAADAVAAIAECANEINKSSPGEVSADVVVTVTPGSVSISIDRQFARRKRRSLHAVAADPVPSCVT